MVGSGKKVLDVGCGSGEIGVLLIAQGNEVFGIDVSTSCVELAIKKGIKARVCDFTKDSLPFDTMFDVVLAGEVIEHLYDTQYFLNNVFTWLKNDGFLVLSTPNVATLGRRLLLLVGKNPHLEFSLENNAAGHIRYFTKDALFCLLLAVGFEIVEFVSDVVNFDGKGKLSSTLLAKLFPTLGRTLIVKCKKP